MLLKDNPKIIYATKTLETPIYWELKNTGSCFSWAPLHTTIAGYAIVDAHFIPRGGVP